MKKSFSVLADLATVGVAIAAIALVGLRMTQGGTVGASERPSHDVENWEEYAVGDWLGPRDASVVIIEWADYECPVCKWFHEQVVEVLDEFPNDVALVVRHWPLGSHRFAEPAARAAVCAGEQGAFKGFHYALYENEDWLGDAFLRFADDAGVGDMERFEACMNDEGPVERLEKDLAAVRSLEGTGTPTLIFDGRLIAFTPGADELRTMIEEALADDS